MTRDEWDTRVLTPARARVPERRADFRTSSGRPIPVVCTPDDLADIDEARDIGEPGAFPFTRGAYLAGYRERPWTVYQTAGSGTPADANAWSRHVIAAGATGLSVAFDLSARMGRDPDHPLAAGDVGRGGVSVASAADMRDLFDGIDLTQMAVSLAIDAPAPMIFALFLVAAEERGVSWASLSGTVQSDVLEALMAQQAVIYPPALSLRLLTDVVAFCHEHLPRWHPVSVSGYRIREAGATAQQELSYTMANGIVYVGEAIARGRDVERVGARMSFVFGAHDNVFEEIAKFRAARQVWARVMRDRFGAMSDEACALRFHARTSGASLTVQEPWNNVTRVASQALAAVLGGASALHTTALDAACASPATDAATLALRTQQVLAYESGMTAGVDPFGGSWLVERMTRDFVDQTMTDLEEIDRMGGMLAAIERGVPQQCMAESAQQAQHALDTRDRVVVGVDEGTADASSRTPALPIDEEIARYQVARVAEARRQRDAHAAGVALALLHETVIGDGNTMERFVACARAGVTVGEMCEVVHAATAVGRTVS